MKTRPSARLWIDQFLERHRSRFDPFDWPSEPDEWTEFVAGWVKAFDRLGIEVGEANAASLYLAEGHPPTYRREHLPAVLEVIRQSRDPRTDPAARTTTDIERRRKEAAVRERMEAEAVGRWESLPAADREAIRAEVVAENPALAKFEPFVRKLCLAKARSLTAS